MRTVEYWRWRYRDVESGRICRTMFPCSAEEAKRLYPDAERIDGTMLLREVDDEPPKRKAAACRGLQTGDVRALLSDGH
jgi:hypothetical protein